MDGVAEPGSPTPPTGHQHQSGHSMCYEGRTSSRALDRSPPPRWPPSPSNVTRSMASGTTPSHPTSSRHEAVIPRQILRRSLASSKEQPPSSVHQGSRGELNELKQRNKERSTDTNKVDLTGSLPGPITRPAPQLHDRPKLHESPRAARLSSLERSPSCPARRLRPSRP